MKAWDYEHGLLQVSASLRRWYGLETEYAGDPAVDAWLREHSFRCVIALLIDGMGSRILSRHLPEDSFFRSRMAAEVSTVYPTTTAAATTAFQTGRSPAENGWLGWNQYFREMEDQIVLFRNVGEYSDIVYPDFSWRTLPIVTLQQELNEKGIGADEAWPGWAEHNPCRSFQSLLDCLGRLAEQPQNRYLYGYWDRLDSQMHRQGPSCPQVQQELVRLDQAAAAFAASLPADVGLLVIADHGQTEVSHYALDADAELCSCLRMPPSLEARTPSFFLKPGRQEEFIELFQARLGSSFELLSHAEAVASGIFGPGTPHPRFEEFLGDEIAFAKGRVQLDYRKGHDLIGNHAGMLEEERLIPVILSPR